MKYIITESQLDSAVIKWLNLEYGDLELFKTEIYPNHTFFMKNGEIVFDYNGNGQVGISYDHIWRFLSSFFGLEKEEIQDLTKQWVEKNYGLFVRRIYPEINDSIHWWRNITN